ncbi:MAG: hypothetical protein JO257_04925 [Deltaproteobacteria bacterium]|nr:hypothetical protein [Deltaproteobacteria bacterium]
MRHAIFLFVLAAGASGCKSVDCGPGTIERNGTCDPSDESTGSAACGDGTALIGDRCEPILPPTKCDPATTAEMPDPNDPSVTICVGTGGGGCSGTFACPTPMSGKTTICGQLYDITDNSKFQGPSPMGAPCQGTETTGPCALKITPYDALAFGGMPTTTQPLANGGFEIDDCGRFRVKDIAQPSSPFIGLGIDDRNATMVGDPAGVTNTTGVAAAAVPGGTVTNQEAWIAPKATTDMWQTSGGPPVSGGIYVGIFRAHKCDPNNNNCTGDKFANQAGVTFTLSGSTLPNDDYYFAPAEVGHTMIDTNASSTGVNGTGLLKNASVSNLINYSGTGGLTDTTNCKWDTKAAASIPNIVFFQVYRPVNQLGKQCTE